MNHSKEKYKRKSMPRQSRVKLLKAKSRKFVAEKKKTGTLP